MAFRKRAPITYSSGSSVLEVVEVESDGFQHRDIKRISEEESAELHPVDMEEFSLSEQMRSGIQIKEIPCEHLLDSNDPLSHQIDETEVLKQITSKQSE